MRGFRIAIALWIGFILLAAGGGVIAGLARPAKSFAIPRVFVDAELEADGSMHVVEHITYDFHGQFSFGTRPIPVGAYQITDMRVTEAAQELPSVGAPYNLQWFFHAKDEQRTFDIEYTVLGAATVGPDVTELYWKWVGEQHPKIDEVIARLTVPPGPGRLRAWGHGELTGIVATRGDIASWHVRDVPEGSFVEGRVAIPGARFTVEPTGSPRLPQILSEERAWARAANAARAAAARDAKKAKEREDLFNVITPIVIGLGIAVYVFLFVRYGREPRTPDIGEYYRDLPDDPPAVVDTLLHWGHVRPMSFGATVIDLAQRGWLTIQEEKIERAMLPDKKDYRFHKAPSPPQEQLADFEERVMKRLFHDGDEITQKELTDWAAAHTGSAQKWWQGFQSAVDDAYDRKKYQQSQRGLVFTANLATATLVAFVGAFAMVFHAWWVGAAAVAWALLQSLLTITLRQRTKLGAERTAQWEGVEHFLRDFSELEDAPSGHLVLWERYLVYAVALGVSEELVRGLALRVPEVADSPTYARWYHPLPNGGAPLSGFATLGSFGASFGSSFAAAATPRSSGSGFSSGGGFSGGFSGGGGGGGGGGGIGAG